MKPLALLAAVLGCLASDANKQEKSAAGCAPPDENAATATPSKFTFRWAALGCGPEPMG